MTITGGSALPKDDIERMMRDAQEHADEDRQRKADAEVRNLAEALQWQTEKFLAESGEKLPQSAKDEVNEALSDLRGALGGSDIERIRTSHEKLTQAAQKAGTMLYGNAEGAGAGGAGAGAGPSAGAAPGGEDVVDAEVVDEDDKK
jgi:molecular chaperone DnaK